MRKPASPLKTPPFPERGFTLVELSMVMMIVGLLIGGILKGQEMIANSRATAVIAQVRSYEAAIATFKDVNDAWPGDLATAAERIPGCNENCTPFIDGRSNDIVGRANWADDWETQTDGTAHAPAASEQDETVLFWTHLMLSGLIGGVNTKWLYSDIPASIAWNETHPATPSGGGYVVGYGSGLRLPGDPTPPPSPGNPASGPNGIMLMVVSTPDMGSATAMTEPGKQPFNASMAARIDDKIDDGLPHSGNVMAYGYSQTCFGSTGSDTPPAYKGGISGSYDCGLTFLIGK